MKRLLAILAVIMPMLSLSAQDLDSQYAVDLLKPGTQAPEFILNDINGKAVKLSDFQGRNVVLIFWASWCPDCRAENYLPGVQLYDPAGKKESKVAADYGVKWIPSLYLLDENGKVVLGTVMIEKIAGALGGAVTLKKPGQELCRDESCAQ